MIPGETYTARFGWGRQMACAIFFFCWGLSTFFLGVSGVRGIEEGQTDSEGPLLVRIGNGTGLSEAYVREAIQALGPLQRATLSMRPMLKSFLRDLAGARLLAGHALAESSPNKPSFSEQPSFERDKSLAQGLIDEAVSRLPPLKDQDLRRFYDENRGFFREGTRIRFRQILVSRRSRAEEIARLLREGAAFEDLARKYSRHPSAKRGGEMGWLREDWLEPHLATGLSALQVGQVGPVIESPFGLHLVEIQERGVPVTTPFEEVLDTVLRRLNLERRQQVSEGLLGRDDILGSRVIEVDLEAVERLLAEFNIRIRAAASADASMTSSESEEFPGGPYLVERRP